MNIALILSGGTGSRLSADIPKQYIEFNNRMIISYCLEKVLLHNDINAVQIVADKSWHSKISECLSAIDIDNKFKGFSKPGTNRQMSILNGLEDIREYADDKDIVFIHDAARPFLTQELITRCLAEIDGHDGVLPVIPMKDTVYLSEDGKQVKSLLRREQIFAGQAPESFVLGKYLDANKKLLPDRILTVNGSTEPAIMAEMDIFMIPGDENNFKITTKADYERFCSLVVNLEGSTKA